MNRPAQPEKAPAYALLVLFLALIPYGLNMYSLASLDTAPPRWDEAAHLKDSIVYHNILAELPRISPRTLIEIYHQSEKHPLLRPSGFYPPLAPLITSLLYFVFGVSARVAVMSNLIFLCLLVFSVYGVAGALFSRTVGLLAGALLLFFPIILQHSAMYYLDLPLAAFVALGYFGLVRSDYFRNTAFSVISGFVFGLGLLVKWTYALFLVGPLGYLLYRSFLARGPRGLDAGESTSARRRLRNVLFLAVGAVAVSGLYYLPLLSYLAEKAAAVSFGVYATSPGSLISLSSLLYYPLALWKTMITPLGFVLFGLGLAALVPARAGGKMFILSGVLVPFVIFTLIPNKDPRLMLPWTVPIALVIAFLIDRLACEIRDRFQWRRFGRLPDLAFMAAFIFLFIRADVGLRDRITDSSREDWKIADMISVLQKDMARDDKPGGRPTDIPKSLGVLVDHEYINDQTLRYYAVLNRLPLNVIKVQNYKATAYQEFVARLDGYDYVLTKSSDNTALAAFQPSTDRMLSYFSSRGDDFERLREFSEPDGSAVSIFTRKR